MPKFLLFTFLVVLFSVSALQGEESMLKEFKHNKVLLSTKILQGEESML